jgi:hypothetical protein
MKLMKHIINFGRHGSWKPGAGILCMILALAAGAGCGKSKNVSSPVEPPSSPNSAATTTPADSPANQMQPALPAVSVNAGQNGPTQVQSLNRAMMGWVMKNHRRPQTFQEFASTVGFQIPDPPAGKKYALNQNGFIILVNSNQ